MKLLLSTLLMFNVSAKAMTMETGTIFLQIKKNKPEIDTFYAAQLSRIIKKMTEKYNISSRLYTAILMQESKYKLEATRCNNKIYYVLKDIKKLQKTCTDFGISQINHRTVSSYNFDKNRLITDLDYSIEAGLIVLSDFKKNFRKEKEWYTRYNCGNKGDTNRDTCQAYKKLVNKYL